MKSPSKSFQVNSVETSETSTVENYKFKLRDKLKAQYIGYDLSKVSSIEKKCKLCASTDHFSIECMRYRKMKEDERLKVIRDLGLCKNCVLTTDHLAKDCTLKVGCGYKFDKYNHCNRKHHLTVHTADSAIQAKLARKSNGKRFPGTRENAAQAAQRIFQAQNSSLASQTNAASTVLLDGEPVDATRKYKVHSLTDIQPSTHITKSVKVFKVKIW